MHLLVYSLYTISRDISKEFIHSKGIIISYYPCYLISSISYPYYQQTLLKIFSKYCPYKSNYENIKECKSKSYNKYFLLSHRVDLLVMKTLRAKVCAYLLSEAEQQGSMTFTIPFSRIQLADYLNCDRSALSRELSLMQRDGLLDTYRSSFKLLEPEALRQMIL